MAPTKREFGIAGARIVVGAIAFVGCIFCFFETAFAVLIAYEAHKRGQIRGVPYQNFAESSVIFAVATCLLGWVCLKMLLRRKLPISH